MDAFIALVTLLQFYHLLDIFMSCHHILSPLRKQHKREKAKKKRLRARTKRHRAASKAHKERQQEARRQRESPLLSPEPAYMTSPYGDWKDREAMDDEEYRSEAAHQHHQHRSAATKHRGKRTDKGEARKRPRDNQGSSWDGASIYGASTPRRAESHERSHPPVPAIHITVDSDSDASSYRTGHSQWNESSLATPVGSYEDQRRLVPYRPPRE